MKPFDHANDTRAGELRDELFWHAVVDDLELGPELEAYPGEDDSDGERIGLIRRFERLCLELPLVPRASLLAAVMLVAVALLTALFIGVAQAVLAIGTALPELLGDRPLKLHIAVAHVVVMAVILVMLVSSSAPREPEGLVARNAWRQFRRGWAALWIAWLGLYVWLGAYWVFEPSAHPFWAKWGAPVADLLNVASSAVFFYLFLVLDRPSVKADGMPERDRAFRRSLVGIGVVCGAAAALSILGRFGQFRLDASGPLVGSILVAIAMAFFVGRLSDSHMKVRRALLAPLYFYVAMQMLWHLFVMQGQASELANSLVLCSALALKVYLFALVTRWIQDGRLQEYFDEVAFPRLSSDVE